MAIEWNKLFLEWLQELIDKAAASQNRGQNSQHIYKRALKSLSESDNEYTHPSELIKLQYFGAKICEILEKRQKKYCKENNVEPPILPARNVEYISPSAAPASKVTKPRKKKQYVPKHRSGGYAILLAMRKLEVQKKQKDGSTRADITSMAQQYCDNSFEANPSASSFYSAWSSMKTLTSNNYVYHQARSFYLTQEGRDMADKLREVEKEADSAIAKDLWSTPHNSDLSSPVANRHSAIDGTPVSRGLPGHGPSFLGDEGHGYETQWEAGTYKIRVFVDTREVKSQKSSRTFFTDELVTQGCDAMSKLLSIGDVVWVAEHVDNGHLAIVDHILERKRFDDLLGSIKDSRFTEQKFRLHRSGCKHVIYLVECPPTVNIPPSERKAYQTALSQTTVIDDFFLKLTLSAEDTVRYLAEVTRQLTAYFKDKPLTVVTPNIAAYKQSLNAARERHTGYIGIDYDSLDRAISKSGMLTVREVFIKMLMTIRGITWDKAKEIQKIYKTPYHLWQAYSALSDEEKKKNLLFDATGHNISRKRVTKPCSERVYEVWGLASREVMESSEI